MKLIERPEYLEKLIRVKGVPDIKVITGIRRCGKSKLMEAFIQYIHNTEKDANIIYIDFTSLQFEELTEYHKLNEYIENAYMPFKNNYLLIDEVQICNGFEKTLNSLHSSGKYDIYVTGSNAIWAVKKTNFDPCPAGYRVPQLKEITIFYDDGNGKLVYTNGTAARGKSSGIFGGYTEREGNFIWIPKAGMRTFGGGDNSSNGYSFTMAYWGDYNYANGPWYDGSTNIWTFNPEDTQSTLTGCSGYGGSWKTPSTGDVHARFVHMCGTNEGPQTMISSEKPVVGVVGEGMSIRCVKIN